MYRAHAAELLDRPATGADTRPATAAERCLVCRAAGQQVAVDTTPADTGGHVARDAPATRLAAHPWPGSDAPTALRDAWRVAARLAPVGLTVALAVGLGVLAGPWLRGMAFVHSVGWRQPLRTGCPACGTLVTVAGRWGLAAVAPVTGRCPSCTARTGPPAGGVEILAATVLAVLAVRAPSGWVLAAWTWLTLLGIALACVDAAVHRLPDPLTTAAAGGVLLLLTADAVASHQAGPLLRALACAAGLGAVYLVAIMVPGGLGRGDGHLALSLGLVCGHLGVQTVGLATVTGVGLAAGAVTLGRLTGALRADDQVALGPYLLAGALTAILASR